MSKINRNCVNLGIRTRRVCITAWLLGMLAAPLWAAAQEQDASTTDSGKPPQTEERRIQRLGDTRTEDYPLELSVPDTGGSDAGSQLDLPDPEQNKRLQSLLSRLAAHPGNTSALRDLDEFLSAVLDQANRHIEAGEYPQATRLLGIVRNVNPHQSGLDDAYRRLRNIRSIREWLQAAETARSENHLDQPAGDSAMDYYHRILALDPQHAEALNGLLEVQRTMLGYAVGAAQNLDFDTADAWLERASKIRKSQDLVEEARKKVAGFHERQADIIIDNINKAIDAGDFEYAEFTLIDLIAMGGHEEKVAALQQNLREARIYRQFKPGQVVQDALSGGQGMAPAVVVIPEGNFLMGSAGNERNRSDNESPLHRVTITRRFALGLQEVTVGQFGHFAADTNYRTEAEKARQSTVWDEASGQLVDRTGITWRDDFAGQPAAVDRPVLHVAWGDAVAYTQWLSQQTGHHYRLPSEAEFEYALRAGTRTEYWWGDGRPRELVENLTGDGDQSPGGRSWSIHFRSYNDGYWGPAPGASFKANPWGLYDLAGNVSEWLQDCWHDTYVGAPSDGSAWDMPDCSRRTVRGGYWAGAPERSRSAARLSAPATLQGPQLGFRVARDL